ncbi:MAG: phosphoribosylamine--glycine ligase [Chloroflexota bacterium]|nr:phosphoribosylamine--glycine ligase [Chloroflexota bacterium]
MRIVVIGSGGREHSIVWKLSSDKRVKEIITFSDNYGISKLSNKVNIDQSTTDSIAKQIVSLNPDLVIVGPEEPLSNGISNLLSNKDIKTFGPTKEAARIESSKIFSKKLMMENYIPTSYAEFFTDYDKAKNYSKSKGFKNIVIKADGLAAGKGVFLPNSNDEMNSILDDLLNKNKLGNSGKSILIEDRIFGKEVSVFCFTDGFNYSKPIAICDYKRVFENDLGGNTGGMGCYTPPEFWSDQLEKSILDEIIEPTIKAMREKDSIFKGMLYTGLMITNEGPKVIEYNCRFGDPECELIMPMFEGEILDTFFDVANSDLKNDSVNWKNKKGVCVVMTSGGYPEKYETGYEIKGLEEVDSKIICFHSGTKDSNGKVITNGGRVLVLSNIDDSIYECRKNIYSEVKKISFEHSFYRKDIGLRAIEND